MSWYQHSSSNVHGILVLRAWLTILLTYWYIVSHGYGLSSTMARTRIKLNVVEVNTYITGYHIYKKQGQDLYSSAFCSISVAVLPLNHVISRRGHRISSISVKVLSLKNGEILKFVLKNGKWNFCNLY